jgi:NADPH2:quinone reductase
MKGVRAYEVGGPEVLKYEDMPEPTPAPGEAIIEIRNIGVNYTDVSSRKGTNPPAAFPWTPGREASGVVVAVGDGVSEVSVGDRVAYAMHTGSYAEQQAVPAWLLVQIPDEMDFPTGAATLLQAMTAHFLVNDIVPLREGERALVHAGAGGMGLLLIQMLKRMGLHVYTTVSTGEKAEMARGAGADDVILYTQQDFEDEVRRMTDGQGVKIIFDAVGATTFEKGLRVLGRRGCMCLYGQAGGPVGAVDSSALRNGSLYLTRPSLGDFTATRPELLNRAQECLDWVQSGEIKLNVTLNLPLSDAAEAHRRLEGRETTGKILLTP